MEDFEVGVVSKLRHNFRAWHSNFPKFSMVGTALANTSGWPK